MSILIIFLALLSAVIIVFIVEVVGMDKLMAGGLLLTSIAFIYVGFAGANTFMLVINSIQASFFFLMAYGGLRKQPLLISLGLALHAVWDLSYLLFFSGATVMPEGYELYCVVIDLALAAYFYVGLRGMKAKTD